MVKEVRKHMFQECGRAIQLPQSPTPSAQGRRNTAYCWVVKPTTTTEVQRMMPDSALSVVEDTPEVRRRKGRSRVTNHKDLLPGIKGSTKAARRFRDLVNGFLVDMGGADQCSDIRIGLLRRLAAVTVQAEVLEAKMINGEAVDIGTLCTLASTTVRLSQRLGIERVPKRRLAHTG